MNASRRLFSYSLAFAGLLIVLWATRGLLVLVVSTVILRSATLMGAAELRSRASFYLAALIVGTPLWLSFWLAAQRRVASMPEERGSIDRRAFFGALFVVTSLVVLFALQRLLRSLLSVPAARESQSSTQEGIEAAARLLIFGGAWLAHARIGWRERRPADADEWHDMAIYLVSGCALGMLAIGAGQALSQLLGDLLGARQPAVLAGPAGFVWSIWGSIGARIIAGGAVWAAVWQYDLRRGGSSELRVGYLYLVLAAAVPTAVGGGQYGLYEVLRRLFGYPAVVEGWSFLRGAISTLVIGACLWVYHWQVLRRQAALAGIRPAEAAGGIVWPRRPVIAMLVLLGLGMWAPAVVSILWLGLDFLLNTARTLSGAGWWRDQLSFSIAAGLIGGAVWLGTWTILQQAAVAAPTQERTADARRFLLATIVLITVLVAVGFTIALLWMLLQTLLGARLDSREVSNMLKSLSGALVLLVLLTYHGTILRRDRALAGPGPKARAVRVVALVAPGAEAVLTALRQRTGHRIFVAGRLVSEVAPPQVDLPALEKLLSDIDTTPGGQNDSVLLLLRSDGGSLHPYARLQHPIS